MVSERHDSSPERLTADHIDNRSQKHKDRKSKHSKKSKDKDRRRDRSPDVHDKQLMEVRKEKNDPDNSEPESGEIVVEAAGNVQHEVTSHEPGTDKAVKSDRVSGLGSTPAADDLKEQRLPGTDPKTLDNEVADGNGERLVEEDQHGSSRGSGKPPRGGDEQRRDVKISSSQVDAPKPSSSHHTSRRSSRERSRDRVRGDSKERRGDDNSKSRRERDDSKPRGERVEKYDKVSSRDGTSRDQKEAGRSSYRSPRDEKQGRDFRDRDSREDRYRERERSKSRDRSTRDRSERGIEREREDLKSRGDRQAVREKRYDMDDRRPRGGRDERDDKRDDRRERDRERERDRHKSRSDRKEDGEHHRDSKRRKTDSGGKAVEEAEEAPVEEEDPEAAEQRAIEERRKRLAAIKAKHQQQAALNESVINPTAAHLSRPQSTLSLNAAGTSVPGTSAQVTSAPNSTRGVTPLAEGEVSTAPADGDKTPEGERSSSSGDEDDGDAEGKPVFNIWGHDPLADDGDSRPAFEDSRAPSVMPDAPSIQRERLKAVATQQHVETLGDDDDDMFTMAEKHEPGKNKAEDEDDMFASGGEQSDGEHKNREAGVTARAAARRGAGALASEFDDVEGFYKPQVGEMIDKRYEVISNNSGKGVFSLVVKARDMARTDEHGNHPDVAIKIIRSNEVMYKAAQTEITVLKRLNETDQDNKKNCIKLLRNFEYRNHMCLVFEPMAMNLRDLTKKVGRNKGLNIEAVQIFTCQLLMALRHLKKNQVLHADIKPDNILINSRNTRVKICDFGSAMFVGENEITPYLVSRFYRPPEVALGMKYDYAMDMWSIGCVVYELFTGRILFPGRTNNEMLRLMMDVKGPFTKRMLKRCAFAHKHFDMNDPNCPFISLEDDPITKTQVRKLVHNPQVKAGISSLLSRTSGDRAKIALLTDLLDKMMMLEPERRIDPDQALRHPFVKDCLPKKDHHHHHHKKRADGA